MSGNLLELVRTALADRYVLQRELGHGGASVVYLAADEKHRRQVAVKVLRPELAVSLGSDRFLREIQLAAQLTHPHILNLYDSGEASGLLYYVMPYVAGESLRQRLQREHRLPLDESLHIVDDVADALGYAHQRGVFHRDIKPENILLASGHALVADFGIASAITVAGEDRVTVPGMAVGTPAYMSPEQAAGEPVDARADIYALGCVLFEMLAGEPPHRGSTAREILARKVTHPMPDLRLLRDSIPGELEAAIATALAVDPNNRFATTTEFVTALQPEKESWATADTGPPSTPSPRSIAVLPFTNMSADREYEYFGDGIAEEITNALTKVQAIRVASRTSAFAFKGKEQDIRRIGRQLGVATVLEGSVRKAGSRLRVTAQLIDVDDGYHIWSERYDREVEDVFAIQDEIADRIVEALEVVLTEDQRQALARPAATNVIAYERYLHGRYFLQLFQKNTVHHAREMFEQAIAIDPGYALAHAGLADTCSFLFMYFEGSPGILDEAERASRRALELAPDLAEAHASSGLALALSKRYDEAEAEFETAIRLNPARFEPYYFYARTCFQQGKLERAARLFECACELSDDYQARLLAALSYAGLGRVKEAEAAYERALAAVEKHLTLRPGDARALTLGAGCLARLGRGEEGIAWTDRALAIDSTDPVVVYAAACVHAVLGRDDEALDGLERALDAGFGNKGWIRNDPDFASLREHPRFLALLAEEPASTRSKG
ncbi:MAG: protein kinase [Gemmatimonadota bacterium]|nr:protein kinase [Gemmatimonadota bacterium]MDH3366550.1 protein kinase [Gemmatimonadota bacterium]MDH3478473.1 protein kinase [Gemmatimonadota bacterium]MDH3569148.1 protein kinase [Gemmatimonadota bacterium]MDH5550093.1 protein kinase [Gemmatimonadota bacterium]